MNVADFSLIYRTLQPGPRMSFENEKVSSKTYSFCGLNFQENVHGLQVALMRQHLGHPWLCKMTWGKSLNSLQQKAGVKRRLRTHTNVKPRYT